MTKNPKGFTLLELLIVMAILGILAGIALAILQPAFLFGQGRNVNRKGDLKQIQAALQNYYADNKSYPVTTTICAGTGGWCGEAASYGSMTTNYVPSLVPQYIKKLPNDPRAGQGNSSSAHSTCIDPNQNGYLYRSDGSEYKLLAHCTPEGPLSATDAFYDPTRPIWAWQISSEGAPAW